MVDFSSNTQGVFRVLIIDDDKDWLDTICRIVGNHTPSGWETVGKLPFDDIETHVPWVQSHKVAAVVIDLKLSDCLPSITYSGHDLVELFRRKLPRLPRFYLTAHTQEPIVEDDEGVVDSAFNKIAFQRSPSRKMQRIFRAASHYQYEYYARNGRIAEIAAKAAKGEATTEELVEIRSLTSIQTPVEIPKMQSRSEVLDRAEKVLEKYRQLLASDSTEDPAK